MPKNNSILTSEQIQDVKDNPKTEILSARIAYIAKKVMTIDDKERELSLNTALNVCSKVTGTPADCIRGRKNYKHMTVQDTFYVAAFCYTGLKSWDIAQCSGCQNGTVCDGLNSLPYLLKDERRFVVMAVMLELERLSGYRVSKNIIAAGIEDVEKAGGKVEPVNNPIAFLSPDKIRTLPVRQSDWFIAPFYNLEMAVIAYRADGKLVRSITLKSEAACKKAYEMQNFGWRFLHHWGEKFIAESKDCKSCSLGKLGKCPAAIMESYFCPKREYKPNMYELASMAVATKQELKKLTYN